MNEPNGAEPVAELRQVAQPNQQPTLEDLINATGPIAKAYFESQERMQERSSAVEEKAIASEERKQGRTLLVVTVLSVGIMILAGMLIFRDHDQSARDLIQLVVSLAAAGFGGYGLGRLRERASSEEE